MEASFAFIFEAQREGLVGHTIVLEDFGVFLGKKSERFVVRKKGKVMRLQLMTGFQQKTGKKSHDKLTDLERRRKSVLSVKMPFEVASKDFDVLLSSETTGVRRKLDMLVTTKAGELVPVEFKAMKSNRGRIHPDHKYQLVVLVLLMEEDRSGVVRRSIVHYMNDNTSVMLTVTESVRRRARTYLTQIRTMIDLEKMPDPRAQCRNARLGCGFTDICRHL